MVWPAVKMSASTDSTALIMGTASITMSSTSRAVDTDSIAAPAGATDSIRCAIPTCWPIAA
jgi:hypothetical protein